MPKTNHNRSFKDTTDYTCPPGDFCKGKHGAAKKKRGAKKFKRSRTRFHQNQSIPKLIDEDYSLETTPHELSKTKPYSKLRVTSEPYKHKCMTCGESPHILLVIGAVYEVICKTCFNKENVNETP